jgi:endonuclease/exonuclease/phosphatase family metal-dependent hydrolase
VRNLFVVGAAWLALNVAPQGRAEILLNEPFTYPDGSLVTVSSGAWITHSGTITGQVQVVAGRALISQTNSEDVSVLIPGQPYGAGTNVALYASFTLRLVSLPTGAGDYFAHFKPTGTSGFRDRIFVTTNGAAAGSFRVGLANNSASPSQVIAVDLATNTDYTLVTRYYPSNGIGTLWLNPSAETDPAITASDSSGALSIANFALRESLSGGSGMGTLYLDNLVIATSFTDLATNSPPGILAQPQSQTVGAGTTASFSVQASGTWPLSYQWQFNSADLPGATNAALILPNVSSNNAGSYSVTITNAFGATNSQAATLTVLELPAIVTQPQGQVANAGDTVLLSVGASGAQPLSYQWQFYATNLPGATNANLSLAAVTTNQAGPYAVVVTNPVGAVTSQLAYVTVNAGAPAALPSLSVMTYNVKGNGATNWSTNTAQAQAIGRELAYLNPDIITFNEIPHTNVWQMTNWIAAFLPGYNLATNSGTDGFINSVIASRFPITRSQKWLDGVSLAAFGYSGNFTRDLFEAQIAVPNFPQPLHVFVTHLKATTSSPQSDADKRAAEASAVSNFLVTAYLTTNALHPYVLCGDMNEDIFRPETNSYTSGQPIQRLVSAPTGLQLTTPVNPVTHSDLTESIQSTLNVRFDYVLPCGLLFSNIVSSQVFRSDVVTNPPAPPLLTTDSRTASDHLPVMVVFGNPYSKPFRLTSFSRSNPVVALTWESVPGQSYRVETSTNLATWTVAGNNLLATNWAASFATNTDDLLRFFRVYRLP